MPLRALRFVLSIPFQIPLLIAVLVNSVFIWTRRGLGWLSGGLEVHVYYVLVRINRRVQGKPAYNANDTLILGIQPRTEADRAEARKDDRLFEVECKCGDPECRMKGMFVPTTLPRGVPFGSVSAAGDTIVVAKRPDIPPPPPIERGQELAHGITVEVDQKLGNVVYAAESFSSYALFLRAGTDPKNGVAIWARHIKGMDRSMLNGISDFLDEPYETPPYVPMDTSEQQPRT